MSQAASLAAYGPPIPPLTLAQQRARFEAEQRMYRTEWYNWMGYRLYVPISTPATCRPAMLAITRFTTGSHSWRLRPRLVLVGVVLSHQPRASKSDRQAGWSRRSIRPSGLG